MRRMKKQIISVATAAACLFAVIQGRLPEAYYGSVQTVCAASQDEVLIVEEEIQRQPKSGSADEKRADTQAHEAQIIVEQIEYSQTQPEGLTDGGMEQGSAMPNGTAQQTGTAPEAGQGGIHADSIVQGGSETDSDGGLQGGSETDSDSGVEQESGTEQDDGTLVEPETETAGELQSESGAVEQVACLGIDNRHRYGGMKQSFSEGYQPKIKENTLYLAVPFTSDARLKDDCLTVGLTFAQDKQSPFVFKNYQKDVARKWYVLQDGVMREDTGQSTDAHTDQSAQDPNRQQAYLYTCEVPLQPDAASGQYSVTVSARGYTEKGEKLTLDYQIFVQIPEPPVNENGNGSGGEGVISGGGGGGGFSGGSGEETEEIIRQPKMLLEECSLTEKGLEAGTQETMRVSFRNRSASQTMYNLKIVIQTESKDIRLGRSSFYFSEVAPEDTIELEDELSVTSLAQTDSVSLNFQFEYEDKKGTAANGTESVVIPIVQPVHVELETGQIPASLYASDTTELSFNVLNLSRTGVYNVRIKLEGDGMFPTEDVFIGNMEAGTQGSAVMRVYVGTRTMEAIGDDSGVQDSEKYGPVSGTVTMQYEDALGRTHEVRQDYQTEIKKAEVLSLKVDKEPEQNSWWISVFAALIAGLLLLVAVLIWRLRRKNVLLEEVKKTEKVM